MFVIVQISPNEKLRWEFGDGSPPSTTKDKLIALGYTEAYADCQVHPSDHKIICIDLDTIPFEQPPASSSQEKKLQYESAFWSLHAMAKSRKPGGELPRAMESALGGLLLIGMHLGRQMQKE